MPRTIRVTVWNEFRHERSDDDVRVHYPEGIHTVVAAYLESLDGVETRTATLDQPEHGLTDEVLAALNAAYRAKPAQQKMMNIP